MALVAGDVGQGLGVSAVVMKDGRDAMVRAEVLVTVEVVGTIRREDTVEARFDVVDAGQTPNSHGDTADQRGLGGGGGLVLGFHGFEQSFEFGLAFAGQDDVRGGEPVGDAVETDGGASLGCLGAGALLGVEAVGLDLFECRHDYLFLDLRSSGVFRVARRVAGIVGFGVAEWGKSGVLSVELYFVGL